MINIYNKDMVKLHVKELMQEAQITPSELMHGARLAQGTAYRLADNRAQAVTFDVLDSLAAYFARRLARPIAIHDLITLELS